MIKVDIAGNRTNNNNQSNQRQNPQNNNYHSNNDNKTPSQYTHHNSIPSHHSQNHQRNHNGNSNYTNRINNTHQNGILIPGVNINNNNNNNNRNSEPNSKISNTSNESNSNSSQSPPIRSNNYNSNQSQRYNSGSYQNGYKNGSSSRNSGFQRQQRPQDEVFKNKTSDHQEETNLSLKEGRKPLVLLPRSIPINNELNDTVKSTNIFGTGKPRDITKPEIKQLEEKVEHTLVLSRQQSSIDEGNRANSKLSNNERLRTSSNTSSTNSSKK